MSTAKADQDSFAAVPAGRRLASVGMWFAAATMVLVVSSYALDALTPPDWYGQEDQHSATMAAMSRLLFIAALASLLSTVTITVLCAFRKSISWPLLILGSCAVLAFPVGWVATIVLGIFLYD